MSNEIKFWWVYQNASFDPCKESGCIWVPKTRKDGNSAHTEQSSITKIGVEDIIFSYSKTDKKIVAISTPIGVAYDSFSPGPSYKSKELGWKLDIQNYHSLKPISFQDARDAIIGLIDKTDPEYKGPFDYKGNEKRGGDIYRLNDVVGKKLFSMIDAITESAYAQLVGDATRRSTESSPDNSGQTFVTSAFSWVFFRVGQAIFRRKLDQFWNERCAVTGLGVRELLRASHIKPWSSSNSQERLDRYNGILLSAAYDSAFDKGLISFTDNGAILFSQKLSEGDAVLAGLNKCAKISNIDSRHMPYLEFHRKEVFVE